MDNIEKEFVDAVIQLTAVRRLREKHLRLLKFLKDHGADTTDAQQALQATHLATEILRKRRKEPATLLVKRQASKETPSPRRA